MLIKPEQTISRRKFLGRSPSMKAISWEVFQSQRGDGVYGQFRLAWGADCITIHALDQTRKDYEYEYLEKLDKIIEALKGYAPVLGTKNHASYREWLNPIETGATGSLAYHYDVVSPENLIFFELASCDGKVRIYPHHFGRQPLRKMQSCLDAIRVELVNHRASFVLLMKAIESVKNSYTEQNKVV